MPEIIINRCVSSASIFFTEGQRLLETMYTNSIFFFKYSIAPCAVNLAFSCELYLKALIAQENNGIIRKGHDLIELFDQLDPVTKYKIRVKYNSSKPSTCNSPAQSARKSFDDCLILHKDSFKQWRYYFEKGQSISFEPVSLYCFANSIRQVYEELYN